MCMGGGGDGGAAERARKQEEERQARIRKGNEEINTAFARFDDDFYNQQTQNYLDYATPQLTDQFNDAAKELTLSLANAGLLNSSVGAQKRAALDKKLDLQKKAIADKGNEYSLQSRKSIDSARGDLQNQNMNLANPTLIAQNAALRAQSLNQLPAYQPLLELFADATDGIATQAALERRGMNRYDTGLFSPKSSQRVIS
tara:strand:- start:227 stop:826 length:600 start_codon:yes stop_codon:yes gene_type:complete